MHFPGYAIVAPTPARVRHDEPSSALAPAAIRGDTVWCIGMSEPNAGSDLAGLQTRAVLDGDHFVDQRPEGVDVVRDGRRAVLLLRADRSRRAEAQGHLDADRRHGHARASRSGRCATSPARPTSPRCSSPTSSCRATNLVGDLNDGWRITQGSLAHERAGLWVEGVARLEQSIAGLIDLARRVGVDRRPGRAAPDRRGVRSGRRRLRALGYKGFASFAQGSSAPEHSYLKLASSELGKALFELGMEIQGPYGAGDRRASAAPTRGRWVLGFFVSFANTIAGGSSEIQRNIIAQRVLGLPRA